MHLSQRDLGVFDMAVEARTHREQVHDGDPLLPAITVGDRSTWKPRKHRFMQVEFLLADRDAD